MHIYASLQDAKNFAADEGNAWGEGSTNDALALAMLESVSRRVDAWCRRSRGFGSGFGPRVGTNRYDATGGRVLDLADDLLSTTSVLSRATTGSAVTTAPAADTDYYLVNQFGRYEPGPFRRAILHGQGTVTAFGTGLRVVDWAGTWGYGDERRTLTATLADDIADDATTVPVSALDEFSPGMTILVDAEQMYVHATVPFDDPTPASLTVDRAVNGTTAATHADTTAIERYLYDRDVVECTLRLWGKRWVARNAGGDGSDGGGDVGTVWPRESEDTILRRTIGHLRLMGAVVFGRSR